MVPDALRTKAELAGELRRLRARIAELERDAAKQKEEVLCRPDKQLRDIYNNLAMGIYRTTPDGRVLLANPAIVRMLGYSSFKKLVQCNLEKEGFEPQYPRSMFKEKIEKDDYVNGLESVWVRRDGAAIVVIENARVVRDEHGKILYYEGTVEDITERKRAEELLRQQKEMLQAILNATTESVFLMDPQGTILTMNNTAAKRLGEAASNMIGRKGQSFFKGKSAVAVAKSRAEKISEVFRTGKPVYFEDERAGMAFYTSAYPALDDAGKVASVAVFGKDVTETKMMQAALRYSEEKYRVLVESSLDVICTVDRSGTFRFMNTIGASNVGTTPGKIIGKTMWDIFPRSIANHHMADIRKVLKTGQGLRVIATSEEMGQQPRWYNTSIEPLCDRAGKRSAAVIVARDITEFKQTQDYIQQYRQNMMRSEQLASLGTLSAMLAHELSQPLTVVGLSIQNTIVELQTSSCPPGAIDSLNAGLAAVSNASDIVGRIRNLARRTSLKDIKLVDICTLGDRMAASMGHNAFHAGVTIKIKGLAKLPLVEISERDLEQVFFSLMTNAIQAADGKKQRKVTITGRRQGSHLELRFADNCGGIRSKHLDRIFEPFFTTKPADQNTGLGLAIVHRIVSEAGGTIRVESTWGRGSTFIIQWPLKD